HGANPENLYRAFNIPVPEKILDFSTNTNILSWPDISLDIERLASSYPDPECTALREIISARENVPMSRILFVNGINQAIFLLAGLFGDDTAILQPCYTEYSRAFTNARDIFTLDDAGTFGHVVICNPNNPTGRFIPDLSQIIAGNPRTTFIIDEAYIDFLRHYEPERLCDFPNAVILRSLTKIFHLSGARVGYVIADENIIDALKSRMPSWSVNAFAQELALKFLADGEFLARTRDFYRVNTPILMAGLREAGFDVVDSDVHYFLVRVDDDMEVIRRLLTRGIAVRHTRNFAGLEGKYVRVATRRPEENNMLISGMKGE
ncbi:MAG: pyridoxal phosphate-dependent class II aminotransferase, partial [Synergistaceae bacterium]|nr:pyridoxal phosphate-dependent class II aminotransferase [Synergistaceae bacterium]